MERVYEMTIAGLKRRLPLCSVSDHLDIAAFIIFGDVELTDADMEYITRVLAAYDENRGEIDAAIEKNSLHWRLSRIPRADLSLMRLAICEMMYMSDVPPKVAINEAVNLSKLYCEEGGPSFINGVLDGCMKNTL